MSGFRTRTGEPIQGLHLNGSQTVSDSGEINASDKKDLAQQIAGLMSAASRGDIVQETASVDADTAREQRRQALTAAYTSNDGEFDALGKQLASEVREAADSQGLMRRLFTKAEVDQGNQPRIRVAEQNVMAIVATSPTVNVPQMVRSKHINPPEFYITTNVSVEERDIAQTNDDLLEEAYFQSQQGIMAAEDRSWKAQADATVGVANDLVYLVGGLTPVFFSQMRSSVNSYGIPVTNCVMSSDYWDDIISNVEFSTWLDPVSKFELVSTGTLGSILGVTLSTDAFRRQNLRVLNQGELYMCGSPEMHGSYTDRDGLQSREIDRKEDGVPARGWSMYELMSMSLHNARSVQKGVRA